MRQVARGDLTHPFAALATQEGVYQDAVQVGQALLVIRQPLPLRPGLFERRLHQILRARPVTDEQPGSPQQPRARRTHEPVELLLGSRQARPSLDLTDSSTSTAQIVAA